MNIKILFSFRKYVKYLVLHSHWLECSCPERFSQPKIAKKANEILNGCWRIRRNPYLGTLPAAKGSPPPPTNFAGFLFRRLFSQDNLASSKNTPSTSQGIFHHSCPTRRLFLRIIWLPRRDKSLCWVRVGLTTRDSPSFDRCEFRSQIGNRFRGCVRPKQPPFSWFFPFPSRF